MKPAKKTKTTDMQPQRLERLLRQVSDTADNEAARHTAEACSRRLYALAYHILSDREAAEEWCRMCF